MFPSGPLSRRNRMKADRPLPRRSGCEDGSFSSSKSPNAGPQNLRRRMSALESVFIRVRPWLNPRVLCVPLRPLRLCVENCSRKTEDDPPSSEFGATRDENEDDPPSLKLRWTGDDSGGCGRSVWPIRWRHTRERATTCAKSPGRLPAGPNRFPQKWQTNGNNSQARVWVPN